MKRIRVLVVDDSVVVRRMLRDVLAGDADIEVAGVAANGRIALAMAEQLNPDLITLDIEMPEMDGIEVLRQLKVRSSETPVIMFSTVTQRGAVATLDALALGARDYVTKPANIGSVSVGMQRIREELVPKIKALCGWTRVPPATPARPMNASRVLVPMRSAAPFEIVVIGTSTGGPNALSDILPQLPADFPVPVAVVQHMPPTFTRFLAERLNASCQLQVMEAGADQKLEAGGIWIAPGDSHISVYSQGLTKRLRSHQGPLENSCRPAVDVLFRTTAAACGRNTLAVILTGMGQDGLRGVQELKSVGATVLAQDEATSVVWGMPGFVVQGGLADRVLPLSQMGHEITRRVVASHRMEAVQG
jgi:two-component system, chemotaxis family, protein-glutamate methylesterase/glutaminase